MADRRTWIVRIAQVALAAVIGFFVWRALSAQLDKSRFLELHFSWPYLVAAWAVLVCYYLLFSGGLLLVIRALGYRPVYRDIFKLSFAANLGKYLPGGVWQVAGKVAMARSVGVDRHAALVASVIESAVSVTGGLLVFVISTLLGKPLPGTVPRWPMWVLMLAIFGALQPQVFRRVIALGMRLLKIDGETPHLTFRATVGLVAYYACIWLAAGAAFRLFVLSLTPQPGADWLAYAGYYAAASIGGLLVLFAPAGLGVREGFLVLLIGPLLAGGAGTAWIVAFAARVWSSLAELALSGVAVALPYAGPGIGEPEAGDQIPADAGRDSDAAGRS